MIIILFILTIINIISIILTTGSVRLLDVNRQRGPVWPPLEDHVPLAWISLLSYHHYPEHPKLEVQVTLAEIFSLSSSSLSQISQIGGLSPLGPYMFTIFIITIPQTSQIVQVPLAQISHHNYHIIIFNINIRSFRFEIFITKVPNCTVFS